MTTKAQALTPGTYLLPERATPGPDQFGLEAPYWAGVQEGRLVLQRCEGCGAWQWGPEWICYACRSFHIGWAEVPTEAGEYRGRIYSWERVWHPTDTALADSVPYVILLVELPSAGYVRMIGNLVGDQQADVTIGAEVRGVFEQHESYALVQWERV